MAKAQENIISSPKQAQNGFDVLDTLKKEKGKGQGKVDQISAVEIIKKSYVQQMKSKDGLDEFMQKLATLLQNPNVKLVQFLNTLFLTVKLSDELAEIKIFTIDSPEHIAMSVRDMARLLQKNNFKKAVSSSNMPEFVDIAQQTGLPVKIGQGQMMMGNQAVPSYTFELDL